MSSNVGLATPRGSGTSGYVQKSLSHLKPRDPHPSAPLSSSSAPSRTPDAGILAHNAARRIEAAVFALRDQLEDAEVDEDEIEAQCAALREKLTKEGDKGQTKLKGHQTHDVAAAKAREDERLRRALGIRGDYEEGGHWREQKERGEGRNRPRSPRRRSVDRGVRRSPDRGRRSPARRSWSPRREYRDLDRPARRERSVSASRSRSRSGSYSD